MESYLTSIIKQFQYYKHLGEKAIDQVPEETLNWSPGEESNSIPVIVKHLRGNMLSRWTDFLTSDGEKEWRQRDAEFEPESISRADLLKIWEEGWKCLFDAVEQLHSDDLEKIIYIRNEGHSVIDAINRQLAHYAYHIGQIVYLARMMAGEKWKSLSIPKGKSTSYNQGKFSAAKEERHFTDEFLNPEKQ